MRFRGDRAPGRARRAWRSLRALLAGRPDPQAPSWRLAAREASDVRSFQDALRRLASAPTELLVGPEPSPLPAGGGRFGWLGRYRVPILWLAAVAAFLLSIQVLADDGRLWGVFVPPVAALIALPLGLAAGTPLRAWRLQVLVAAVAPLLVPPLGSSGVPWPPTLVFVAMYVTFTVAVRLELHLVVGVWLVTDAVIVLGYLFTGAGAEALDQALPGILLATVLIALGYLIGTRRRLTFELVEGRRREQEEQARSTLLEERARIARELHDVVAHHMSVIAVRAETAPFRIPGLPDAVKDDMAETSAIAREALTEMRRLLGVLRGADAGPERAPQPGMDRRRAGRRAGGGRARGRRPAAVAVGGGAVGLPDPAGGAQQRAATRARGVRRGRGRLRARAPAPPGPQRPAAGSRHPRAGRARARHRRHARAGRHARRHPVGRTDPRRRLPGRGGASP
jgi:signal transduction histidine kinase